MAKGKTAKKPRNPMGSGAIGKTVRSPVNGAEILAGNHAKNTGGKKGRSGRWPKEFSAFLTSLREDPDTQQAIIAAVQDPNSRGFAAVLRALLHPEELTTVH